jgi:hypothetical protein
MREDTDTKDRRLPAFTQCRTRQINADYSECLAQPLRPGCIHAFLFGDGYLCTHPLHRNLNAGSQVPLPAAAGPKIPQVSPDHPDNS